MDEQERRKNIADVLDQFGFVISSRKYYTPSAEMNGEIVKATDSLMDYVQQLLAAQRQALRAEIEKKLPDSPEPPFVDRDFEAGQADGIARCKATLDAVLGQPEQSLHSAGDGEVV